MNCIKKKKERNFPLRWLLMKRRHYCHIIRHSLQEYPREACGILGGAGEQVEKIYLLKNTAPDPNNYQIDPEEQLRVFLELEEEGLGLLAIFHSHPGGPPLPSKRDLQLAFYPEALHLILSLQDGKIEEGLFTIQRGICRRERFLLLPGETG